MLRLPPCVSLLTGERRAVRSYVCPFLASCPFVRAYGTRVHARGSGNRSDEEDLRFRRVCACVRAPGNDHTDECRLLSLTEPLREVSLPRTEMEAETKGRRRRQSRAIRVGRSKRSSARKPAPSVYADSRSSPLEFSKR